MSLIYMEGFELIRTPQAIANKYLFAQDFSVLTFPSGRYAGGTALEFAHAGGASNPRIVSNDLNDSDPHDILQNNAQTGFAINAQMNAATLPQRILTMANNGADDENQHFFELWMVEGSDSSNFDLELRDPTASNTPGTVRGNTGDISYGAWHTVELVCVVIATNFQVVVNVDGAATPIDGGGASSGIGNHDNVTGTIRRIYMWGFGNSTAGSPESFILDDWYIIQANTAGELEGFQGDWVIEGVNPVADTATLQWAPFESAPTGDPNAHWNKVRDYAVSGENDGDVTYVSTTQDLRKDLWTFGTLSFITGNILGVQLNGQLKLAAADTRTVKYLFNDGTTDGDFGSTFDVTSTNYRPFLRILETRPQNRA